MNRAKKSPPRRNSKVVSVRTTKSEHGVGKNVRETIAAHLLRQMKEAIDDAKGD